jgi:hypothetical protein
MHLLCDTLIRRKDWIENREKLNSENFDHIIRTNFGPLTSFGRFLI